MGTAGSVVWITGMSGAGKTSVAAELSRLLADRSALPVTLDGDGLRHALGISGQYAEGERRRLAYVYARLCRMLAAQGHVVICATIALFHEIHRWNRENIPGYIEVLLSVPMQELHRRDSKGVYDGGRGSPVVGMEIDAELPVAPDLVITNFGPTTPAQAAQQIFDYANTCGAW